MKSDWKNKPSKYGKDFVKIKFNSGDNLPLNKILKLHNLAIVTRSAFQADNKYYPQALLDVVFMNYKMLEYDRIDVLNGIDANKTNISK